MNVAFELRRRPEGRHAIALLFPGGDVAALLGLCGRLGLDPSGRTFAVAGGFLLKLDEPTPRPIPGAIRLRALAEDLYLPADAELVPRCSTTRPRVWRATGAWSSCPAAESSASTRAPRSTLRRCWSPGAAAPRLGALAPTRAARRADRGDHRRLAERVAGGRARLGRRRDRNGRAPARRIRPGLDAAGQGGPGRGQGDGPAGPDAGVQGVGGARRGLDRQGAGAGAPAERGPDRPAGRRPPRAAPRVSRGRPGSRPAPGLAAGRARRHARRRRLCRRPSAAARPLLCAQGLPGPPAARRDLAGRPGRHGRADPRVSQGGRAGPPPG